MVTQPSCNHQFLLVWNFVSFNLNDMHLNYFEFCKLARVLMDWKLRAREGIKRRRGYKTKISDHPCPHQEGSVECGYFVVGFMRDVVLNGIDVLERKESYT